MAKARAGDTLRLDVIHDGKRKVLEVKSGIRPSEKDLASNDNTPGRPGAGGATPPTAQAPAVLGLSLMPLDDAARRGLNLPPEVRGVVVGAVVQTSDAGLKGLRRGDVIVRVGNRPVLAASDLAAEVDAARKAGRTSVLVGVYRAGRTTFLPLKVSG